MAFALLSNKSALLGQALAAKPAVGRAQVQLQQRSVCDAHWHLQQCDDTQLAVVTPAAVTIGTGKTCNINCIPQTIPQTQASRIVTHAASARPVWFPGNKRPEHLDGDFADAPGNFGFDPLSLGSDPATLKWYQQAELVHSRWAMIAVAGILFPEIATKAGTWNAPIWTEAGQVWANDHPEIPQAALFFVELLLMGWVETKRWQDFRNPGSQGDGSFFGVTDGFKGKGNGYPGGLFDPLGLSKGTEEQLRKYQENEIKNGRLAMVALLGFIFQAAAYPGKGPVQNLVDHVQAPYTTTFATNGVSLPFLNPSW